MLSNVAHIVFKLSSYGRYFSTLLIISPCLHVNVISGWSVITQTTVHFLLVQRLTHKKLDSY